MDKRVKVFLGFLTASVLWIIIWLVSCLSGFDYTKKTELTLAFSGAVIGGLSTLIALYVSTEETRRIQCKSENYNRAQLKIQITNEKIRDYKEYYLSITPIYMHYEKIFDMINIISSNEFIMKDIFDFFQTMLDLMDLVQLNSKCCENDIINKTQNDIDILMIDIVRTFEKIFKREDLLNSAIELNGSSLGIRNKLTVLQVEIRDEINELYKKKYSLQNI